MDKLFGISMNTWLVVMLILLAVCLVTVAWIWLRHRVIFKLGVRNIPRRKSQTALIVIGLMLATLIISAALGTGDTLTHWIGGSVYKQFGPVDEVVVHTSGDAKPSAGAALSVRIPESQLQYVRDQTKNDPNVDGVGGLLAAQSPVLNMGQVDLAKLDLTSPAAFEQIIKTAKQSEPVVNVAGIDEQSLKDLGGLKTKDGKPVTIADMGSNGVVLTSDAADQLQAVKGDILLITLNNQPHAVKVVGIADNTVLAGAIQNTGQKLEGMSMPLANLQAMMGAPGQISAIAISNKGDSRAGVKLTDEIVNAHKSAFLTQELGIVPLKQDAVKQADQIAQGMVAFFIIFGLFSIAVGILLIVLIFTMLAAERRSEMGMARAVGAQRRQLIQQFIAEGTGYALIAGLVGALLGALAAGLISGFMGLLFAGSLDVTPHVTLRSIVIAYCLGTVITFIAVALSSWRVSRLNVVAAVRDIPDSYNPHKNKRQLMWGVLMVIGGAILTALGHNSHQAFSFYTGMSLIPLGIAAILTYFGLKPRLVLTLAGLYLLALWLLPESVADKLWGKTNGNIEMFFLSGIFLVAAATLIIVQNLRALLALTQRLGGAMRGKIASIRMAVAYPGATPGRTGMTIAMFSLIVFSLVMVATLVTNFSKLFLGTEATAGWTIRVDVPQDNPVANFEQALKQRGIDVAPIQAIGTTAQPGAFSTQFRNPNGAWKPGLVTGADASFLDNSKIEFQARANGYDSDQAIINALQSDPNVAIIDASAIPQGGGGFGGGNDNYQLEGITANTKTFAAPTIDIISPEIQTPHKVKIIGVLDQKISSMFGLYVNDAGLKQIFPSNAPAAMHYYVKVAPGTDTKAYTLSIKHALLPNGAQAVDIKQELKDAQKQSSSFLYILEGFMGLGLIVGIAAVGVVAFRAVIERRQSIGMLRALGFQRSMVQESFVIESAVIVLLGVLSGAVLGIALAYILLTSNSFTNGEKVTVTYPWVQIVLLMAVAVVAALLMSWLPARQASRVHPAEALRYE